MLINITQSGQVEYGLREFYLDTPSDLESLKQVACNPGSSAYIISTGETYIKNSQGEWILRPNSGGGGGGGNTPIDPSKEYIWDGGYIV